MLCSVINAEYEYIALHRDVGETELKQVGLPGSIFAFSWPDSHLREEKSRRGEISFMLTAQLLMPSSTVDYSF